MTKEQLIERTRELFQHGEPLLEKLLRRAIASGSIDIEGAEDNYRLPKKLASAIYKEVSEAYIPQRPTKEDIRDIENIHNLL